MSLGSPRGSLLGSIPGASLFGKKDEDKAHEEQVILVADDHVHDPIVKDKKDGLRILRHEIKQVTSYYEAHARDLNVIELPEIKTWAEQEDCFASGAARALAHAPSHAPPLHVWPARVAASRR